MIRGEFRNIKPDAGYVRVSAWLLCSFRWFGFKQWGIAVLRNDSGKNLTPATAGEGESK